MSNDKDLSITHELPEHAIAQGYKQTEVGVIPEDWEVVSIGIAGQVLGGRQRSPNRSGDITKYLRVANVFDGYINTDDVLEMPFSSTEKEQFRLKTGDILLNEGQSLDLVGRSAVYNGNPVDCCFQNTLIRFRAGPQTLIGFAQSIFQQYLRTKVFASIALQTTSIAHLGAGRLAKLKMPLPTLAEQEAIASALSDADALIEALERLLAKKRQVKQGAMQELLTGKRRLPGFSGEWEVRCLGDVAQIVMGQSPSSAFYNKSGEGLPLIQGNADIINRYAIKRIFTSEITKQGKAGDILMSVRAPVGEISRTLFDVCLGRGVCAFQHVSEFFYYALIAKEPTWTRLSKGSTFDSINSTDVKSFAIELPTDIAEQSAIATVLSDMDAEIDAIEGKLDKARRIKQGMMQELLTGKIRLV